MAHAPMKRCAYFGCRVKVPARQRYCEEHARERHRQTDSKRPTSAKRGYDRRWRAYRLRYLKEHPLCLRCEEVHRRLTPATVVDHIQPVENGHADPLFWEPSNHQPLCHDCHTWKTRVIDKRGYGS